MLSLYDEASIAAVMEQPIEPALKSLLQARLDQAAAADLLSLTHLLVVQPGDTEAQIVTEIGFSPLVGRANGWDDALHDIWRGPVAVGLDTPRDLFSGNSNQSRIRKARA